MPQHTHAHKQEASLRPTPPTLCLIILGAADTTSQRQTQGPVASARTLALAVTFDLRSEWWPDGPHPGPARALSTRGKKHGATEIDAEPQASGRMLSVPRFWVDPRPLPAQVSAAPAAPAAPRDIAPRVPQLTLPCLLP